MLGKIPDFNQTPSKSSSPITVADLAAVTIFPSRFLYLVQSLIYLVMLLGSLLALRPFFHGAWYWLAIWLAFSFALVIAANSARRTKNALPKQLRITSQRWYLSCAEGEFLVRLNGEMLLWSWLIIIPLRAVLSGRLHYLVALPDSLDREAWRRLSVWLNLCFTRG